MFKRMTVTVPWVLALTLTLVSEAQAQSLADFQFEEGQGATTSDEASSLVGALGTTPDPIQRIRVLDDSPSGQAGDRSVDFNRAEHLVINDEALAIRGATVPGAFTVEAWFKSEATENPSVLGAYGGPGNGWSFGIYAGSLTFTQAGVADINSGMEVPIFNAWTHVACVYEPLPGGGARITFYVDGFPAELDVAGSINPPQANLLRIGAWLNGGFGPSGSIDRFRIHSVALTAEQLDSVAAQPKQPLPSTVVAYNFNEESAPFESSVSNRPDAIPSFSFFTDAPQWVTDTPSGATNDSALSFNGASLIQVEDPTGAYQAEASDLTLQAWVKPRPATATQVVLVYGPPGGYLLGLTSGNQVQFTALGIADVVSTAAVPSDGGWHHIAAVHRQGQEVLFYIDGSLRDTRPFTGGINASETQTLLIGQFPGAILGFSGVIDRVKVDRAALSLADLDWRPVPGVDPTAPPLSIERAALLAWPTTPPGFILQVAETLQEPVAWTDVPAVPTIEGARFLLYIPVAETNKYYRLFKP